MEKIVYTEEEAIMFCIEKEVRNSKNRLESYLKLGKLKVGNPTKSLTKDLLLFYRVVKFGLDENEKTLLGTDRTYVCEDLRDKPLEKTSNHVGTEVAKDQTTLLMEYVLNQLLETKQSKGYTYKGWANALNIHNVQPYNSDSIKQMFHDYYSVNESTKVTNILIDRLEGFRELIIIGSFNKLVKANRITQETVYFTKVNRKVIEVDEETFLAIENRARQLAVQNGITYKQYVGYNRSKMKPAKGLKKIVKIVKSAISEEFNVDSIFRAYRIKVINRKKHLAVSREMMIKAYFEKLVALTERNLKKMNDEIEKNKQVRTGFVEKEFAAFNIFLLIHQHLGEMDLEERLLKLLPTKEQIQGVQEIHRQHGIEKASKEADRIRNSKTFIIEDEY